MNITKFWFKNGGKNKKFLDDTWIRPSICQNKIKWILKNKDKIKVKVQDSKVNSTL
jgi:hypothetical protein